MMKYVFLVDGEPTIGTLRKYANALQGSMLGYLTVSANVWVPPGYASKHFEPSAFDDFVKVWPDIEFLGETDDERKQYRVSLFGKSIEFSVDGRA